MFLNSSKSTVPLSLPSCLESLFGNHDFYLIDLSFELVASCLEFGLLAVDFWVSTLSTRTAVDFFLIDFFIFRLLFPMPAHHNVDFFGFGDFIFNTGCMLPGRIVLLGLLFGASNLSRFLAVSAAAFELLLLAALDTRVLGDVSNGAATLFVPFLTILGSSFFTAFWIILNQPFSLLSTLVRRPRVIANCASAGGLIDY